MRINEEEAADCCFCSGLVLVKRVRLVSEGLVGQVQVKTLIPEKIY